MKFLATNDLIAFNKIYLFFENRFLDLSSSIIIFQIIIKTKRGYYKTIYSNSYKYYLISIYVAI